MNAKHVELLRRLEQFQLDSPDAAFPFSARLARENNWPPAHTQRVIAEYKRFAFLAVAAGHPVSPSEDVDQAWHLHLTYSVNYWRVFCPEILGQPLHHQPTKGGGAEREKFDDWYQQTLESYRKFFGAEPPGDIWPGPATRANEKHNFVRVDRERSWVIPKPRLRLNLKLGLGLGLGALTIFCSGAMLAHGANPFDWRGPDFLTFYVLVFATCFGLALWLRRQLRTPRPDRLLDAPELDGYATAFLNGGRILTVNTAIANLIRQKAMRADAKAKRLFSLLPRPEFGHILEEAVYHSADSTNGVKITDARENAKPLVTYIADDLKARGLVLADAQARKAIAIPLLLTLLVIVGGGIKICIGLGRDKPVVFLIALCAVTLIASLLAFARRPLRSRQGDAVLKQLQERHVGSRKLGRNTAGISTAEFATVVGLFGMTALAGTELDDLRKSLQPPGSASGCGASCGSGCGGGGCGGGCGGCGGS